MKITITKSEQPIPVTILQMEGKLEGSSYAALIEEAQKLYDAGARDLLLDLSKLTFISSAGLAGLHQVALLFRGEKSPGQDEGWAAYHSIDRDRDSGNQELHVKLLSPSYEVRQVLNLTGFISLFHIFTDLQTALVSFRQGVPATPVFS